MDLVILPWFCQGCSLRKFPGDKFTTMTEWDKHAFCCDPMFSHTPYWSTEQLDSFIRLKNNQIFTPCYHGYGCSKGLVGKKPPKPCPRDQQPPFKSLRISIYFAGVFFQTHLQSIRKTLIPTKNDLRYFGKN